MAKRESFDLEGQENENTNLRPLKSDSERPLNDVGMKSEPNGMADLERLRKDEARHYSDQTGMADAERPGKDDVRQPAEGSRSGPHGTLQDYERLVGAALTNSQLDSHVLAFDFLHRLVLLDHQRKLADCLRNYITESKTERPKISDISESLHAYTKAAADYMFWKDKKQINLDTNVHSAASQAPNLTNKSDANLPALYKLLIPGMNEIQALNAGSSNCVRCCCLSSETSQGPRQVTEFTGRQQSDTAQALNHFAMAFVGGLSMIVPVLIMALHRSRVTSLVVTSVAVTLFAIVLSIWPLISRHFPWMKGSVDANEVLRNKDVLTATAAYAAVLVVFVGASLSTVQ